MFECCSNAHWTDNFNCEDSSNRPDDARNQGYSSLHRISIAMGFMAGPNRLQVGDLLIIEPRSQEFNVGHYPDYITPGMTVTYLEEDPNMPRPCRVEIWEGGPQCWMKWEDVRLVQMDPTSEAEGKAHMEEELANDLFEQIVRQTISAQDSGPKVQVRLFDIQGEVLDVDCRGCTHSEAKAKIAQHLGITVSDISLKHSEISSFEIREHWQVKQGGCLIVEVDPKLLESARREKAIAMAKAAAEANGVDHHFTFESAVCEESGKVKLTYTAVEGEERLTFVHTFVYDPQEKMKPQFQKVSKVREIVKNELRKTPSMVSVIAPDVRASSKSSGSSRK